ncbi:hypothetical protein XACLE3_6540011 [Xanthomonas citri pv. citri]|nr:hypothetical protein XACLE3_6540011 [Xanthomonas citri pv. citri]
MGGALSGDDSSIGVGAGFGWEGVIASSAAAPGAPSRSARPEGAGKDRGWAGQRIRME